MRYLPMIALALPLAAAGCSGCEKKDAPAAEPQAAAAPAAAEPAPVTPPPAAPVKMLPMAGENGGLGTKAPTFMTGATGANDQAAATSPEAKLTSRRTAAETKLKRLPTRLRLNPRLRAAPAGTQAPDGTKQ